MMLSIIVPVYNEEKTIKNILEKIQRARLPVKKEVVVVDDGSTDNTKNILRKLKEENKNIRLVFHKQNKGKTAAIKTALKRIRGIFVIIQDADLEYNPVDYRKLLNVLLKRERCGAVYGSRFLKPHRPKYYYLYLGNKLLAFITNLLYGSKLTDIETCYKLFRTEVLKKIKLESKGFGFEPEITAKLLKRKSCICEVPISYHPRSFAEGKKIKWKDGIISLYILIKLRFTK